VKMTIDKKPKHNIFNINFSTITCVCCQRSLGWTYNNDTNINAYCYVCADFLSRMFDRFYRHHMANYHQAFKRESNKFAGMEARDSTIRTGFWKMQIEQDELWKLNNVKDGIDQ